MKINNDYFKNIELPSSLTPEEETELFIKFKRGDLKAREVLIEHNMRLVPYIVKNIKTTKYPTEDIMSVGYITLIRSVDSFDYQKGFKFSSFACKCIRLEIYKYLIRNDRSVDTVSYDNPNALNDQGYSNISLLNLFSDIVNIEEDFINNESISIIIDKIKSLSHEERELITKFYGLFGEKRIHYKDFDMSNSTLRRHVDKILTKVIKELYEDGIIEHNTLIKKTRKRKQNKNLI